VQRFGVVSHMVRHVTLVADLTVLELQLAAVWMMISRTMITDQAM
jgi:hypothetical protein